MFLIRTGTGFVVQPFLGTDSSLPILFTDEDLRVIAFPPCFMIAVKKEIIEKIKADNLTVVEAKKFKPGILLIVLIPYIENLSTEKAIKLMNILLQVIQDNEYNDILLEGYEDVILNYLLSLPERLPMAWEDDNYFIYIFDKINNRVALNRLIQRGKIDLFVHNDKLNFEWIDSINKQTVLDAMLQWHYKLENVINDPNLVSALMFRIKNISNVEIAHKIVSIIAFMDKDMKGLQFQSFIQHYSNKEILSRLSDAQVDCIIIIGNAFTNVAILNFLWISTFLSIAMEHLNAKNCCKIQVLMNYWYVNEKNKPNFKITTDIQNDVDLLLKKPKIRNKIQKRPDLHMVKGWCPADELRKVLIERKTKMDAPRDSDDDSNFDDQELNEIDYLEVQPSSKLKQPSFIRQIIEYLSESEDTYKTEAAYSNILPILEKSDVNDVKQVLCKLISMLVSISNNCHLKSFENIPKALVFLIVQQPDMSCSAMFKILLQGPTSEKIRIIDAMVVAANQLKETNSFLKYSNVFILTLLNSFDLKHGDLVIKRYALAIQTIVLFSKDAYMLSTIIPQCVMFYVKLSEYKNANITELCIKGVDACFQIVLHSRIDIDLLFKEMPIQELLQFGAKVPEKSLTAEMIKLLLNEA